MRLYNLTLEQRSAALFVSCEFAVRVESCLKRSDLKEMRRRNALQTDPSICHTHDFCDANALMDEAFVSARQICTCVRENVPYGETAVPVIPDANTDDFRIVWDAAWEYAKLTMFQSTAVEKMRAAFYLCTAQSVRDDNE